MYEQSAAFSESCRAHQDSTLSLIHRVLKLRTDLFNAVIAEAQGIDPVRLSELQTAAGNFAYQLGGLTPEFSSIREYNVYHLTVELARATTEALYLQRVMRAYDKTHSNGVACPNTIFFDENLHASQTEMGLFSNFSVTARVVFILLQIAIPCYQYYRPIILI